MSMNWWNFKRMAILILVCLSSLNGYGEVSVDETYKYKKRVESYRDFWESLMPTYSKIQYAGGMGLVNLGLGWQYGKKDQWETDVFLGFIPRYSSDETKITFTLKQNFIPWQTPLNKALTLEPLTCALYFNTVFSDEFWTQQPDRYPSGYYRFSTRFRTHLSIGQRLRFNIPDSKRFFSRSITAFYEISTCDFYLANAFTNRLGLDDYLRLSFGLKFDIF